MTRDLKAPGSDVATAFASASLPLLEISGLHCLRGVGAKAYRVELPRLTLRRGEVLALTGASGSGKSTLLEVLGLVAAPLPGARFTWLGGNGPVDLAALWRRDAQRSLARLRAAGIGFVMQTGGLLPFLTVRENLGINRRLIGLPEDGDDLRHLIERLEIGPLLDAHPRRLSVGQQQRASIGRALAHAPTLLLADEPTSALDPRLAGRVLTLLLDLAAELGTAVVIATHEHERVHALGLHRLDARLMGADGDNSGAAIGARFEAAST